MCNTKFVIRHSGFEPPEYDSHWECYFAPVSKPFSAFPRCTVTSGVKGEFPTVAKRGFCRACCSVRVSNHIIYHQLYKRLIIRVYRWNTSYLPPGVYVPTDSRLPHRPSLRYRPDARQSVNYNVRSDTVFASANLLVVIALMENPPCAHLLDKLNRGIFNRHR